MKKGLLQESMEELNKTLHKSDGTVLPDHDLEKSLAESDIYCHVFHREN